jgi:hypothetical protein
MNLATAIGSQTGHSHDVLQSGIHIEGAVLTAGVTMNTAVGPVIEVPWKKNVGARRQANLLSQKPIGFGASTGGTGSVPVLECCGT